jgi:PAS domain S-box-containing protein
MNTPKKTKHPSKEKKGSAASPSSQRMPSKGDLLHTLLDNMPDSIYFKDLKSRFIRVNKYWAQRAGLKDPKDAIGRTDFDCFTPEHARQAFNDEQEIISSGKPMVGIEEKETWPDKPDTWVSTTKMPLWDKDGNIIGTFGISRDITEIKKYRDALQKAKDELEERVKERTSELSKQIEERLAYERTFLAVLMDNIPDTNIYFKDTNSRFTHMNKSQAEIMGLSDPAVAIGKTDFDFFDHAQEFFDDEKRIMQTGEMLIGKLEKVIRRDGSFQWYSSTKMPIWDKQGKVIGLFGISRDFTKLKEYEDALQKAKDELEERVKERTAELSEAKFKLEQNLEQLKFLNVTAYELAQIIDINEMFDAIGKAFSARFPFAQISICQKTKNGFSCVFAAGLLDSPECRALSETALKPFLQKELSTQLFTENWSREDHLKLAWPEALREDPCWIALPLQADNKMTLAIVQLFVPSHGETVFRQEQTLLSTLAAHAATCLSNALHYKELEVKARLEGELEAARNIQQSLMPHDRPSIPRISLAGAYQPAYEVGGDYLDYFKCGDGSWAVIVADVCGKGVPAAMLMTVLRSIARVECRSNFTAKKLLTAVNESICRNINERSFITALCLAIKADGSSMTYARAGHAKLLRRDAAQESIVAIESKGLALGIVPDTEEFASHLEEIALPLIAGESFLAYTDGITEANNTQKQFYGLSRLVSMFKNLGGATADHLVKEILDDVQTFTHGKPPHDDITMFAMKVTG